MLDRPVDLLLEGLRFSRSPGLPCPRRQARRSAVRVPGIAEDDRVFVLDTRPPGRHRFRADACLDLGDERIEQRRQRPDTKRSAAPPATAASGIPR
jgi:hypothetical protein